MGWATPSLHTFQTLVAFCSSHKKEEEEEETRTLTLAVPFQFAPSGREVPLICLFGAFFQPENLRILTDPQQHPEKQTKP